MHVFQKGFNFGQDGPGNRLVYHLQGCNLHCPWCSNPEGMPCENPAATAVTVEALVAEAVSAKPMFFEKGGVTFTGGEATLPFEELKEALTALTAAGISTALETNGTHPRLPELFPVLTHLIVDLKHPDDDRHRAVTGLGNGTVKRNLRAAAAAGGDLLVRVPLIGGFNVSDEALAEFLAFFAEINAPHVAFELLPYHEYGKDKWARCGRVYTVENAFVSEETRLRWERTMQANGLRTVRT